MSTVSNFAEIPADSKHLINTYVSDMVVLMQHIAQPLDSQIEIAKSAGFADAEALVTTIKGVATAQISLLDDHLKNLGGSADHPVKSAWSTILGLGAGAVNQIRSTKVSKALRDDYTALGLAAISYTMLHATAVGIGDGATATLAKAGLDQVAPLVVKISQAVPAIVLAELRADGENVSATAAEATVQAGNDAWNTSG